MLTHEPLGYDCPFCRIVQAISDETHPWHGRIIYADDAVLAIVALHTWDRTPFNTLVMPREHIENVYALPSWLALPIHRAARALARSIRVFTNCDGISIRQNNEPWGSQDVWHYHMHVTPRFERDHFHESYHYPYKLENAQINDYAAQLRQFIAENPGMFDDDWSTLARHVRTDQIL